MTSPEPLRDFSTFSDAQLAFILDHAPGMVMMMALAERRVRAEAALRANPPTPAPLPTGDPDASPPTSSDAPSAPSAEDSGPTTG